MRETSLIYTKIPVDRWKRVVGLPVPSEPAAGVHLTCFLAEATVLRPDLFER